MVKGRITSRATSSPQGIKAAQFRVKKCRTTVPGMRCFVYVLGAATRHGVRTYIGWTTDLDRRLARHNSGSGARATRGHLWGLLYVESYSTRTEAMSREWHLKRDRAFRKRLISGL